MKKLYYISTNGYDCIVSADEEANIVRILDQTDFPAEWDYDVANRRELTENGFFGAILNSVEDDSSWEIWDDVNADEKSIRHTFRVGEDNGADILAKISVEI